MTEIYQLDELDRGILNALMEAGRHHYRRTYHRESKAAGL
jgi:DNA-binding Lrp family transcriptional regulator